MSRWLWLFLAALVGTSVASAAQAAPGTLGDDDPFPVACINFEGQWRSDWGQTYEIDQKACKWLRIRTTIDSQNNSLTIVPDGKARSVSGQDWTGTVRHRWNSLSHATMVETHRSQYFEDHTVTEFVTLEQVNQDLLLESTYRTVEYFQRNGTTLQENPTTDYRQVVLRREKHGSWHRDETPWELRRRTWPGFVRR